MGKRDNKDKDRSKLSNMLDSLQDNLLKDMSKFLGGKSNHNSGDDHRGISDDCPQ